MAEYNSDGEKEPEKSYKLIFRYRHIKKVLNFYPPPKRFSEEHEHWDQLIEATHSALEQAFGEIAKYIVGIAQFVHGPVVPLSVVLIQPKRYSNCYLDLVIDDECPFLSDIQSERKSSINSNGKDHNEKIDKLKNLLEDIQLESWYETLVNQHKIDYESFLLLDKEDLKEMQIPIGVRKKFLQQIEKEKIVVSDKRKSSLKTKWEDSQRTLSLPTHFPIKTVEPIPYHRLLDVKYRESYADFLRLHLRYFGWTLIKLPPDMVEKLEGYKKIWNAFFDREQEYKDACVINKEPAGAYGGYYDENDRQMFQVVPLMLGCNPPWPEGDPEFQEKAVELFFFLEKITKTCFTALAQSLGIDPQLFLSVCEEEYATRMLGSSVRVCKYKKQEQNTGIICVPHTDTTILSLGAVSSVPELQFYDRTQDKWIDAETNLDESHMVLFVGRMLARMTAGYFQPTYHRVFRRYSDERLSLPFFLRARDSAIFEIEKIIKTSNIPNWELPGGISPTEILISEGGKYDFKPYPQ